MNRSPKLQTFHSLTFHACGTFSRGCEAITSIKDNVNMRVSGGVFDNGADGATTYDVDVFNNQGQPLSVRGYRVPLRRVTCDDVTCLMLYLQRARPHQIRTRRARQVAGK